MKSATRIDYAGRIERAVAHLERLPPDAAPPTVDDLAGIAALSSYHFHRVFRLMTGETVVDLLRRIRLARSLPVLEEGGSVTAAAGQAGYATSQAYARALKAVTGDTASALMSDRARLGDAVLRLARATDTAPLAVQVVVADPLRLLTVRNTHAYGELNADYERLFAAVFAQVAMERLKGVHGLFIYDPRDVTPSAFEFHAGLEIAGAAPEIDGVTERTTFAGRHLMGKHVGDYGSLLFAIDGLYAICLAAGLEMADAPLRTHYVDTPDEAPSDRLRTEIYLPLAAAA